MFSACKTPCTAIYPTSEKRATPRFAPVAFPAVDLPPRIAVKVLFYLATDQQGIRCYAANAEFSRHPEWHLKLDNGTTFLENGSPVLDPTLPAAAQWWASIPLGGINGTGQYDGIEVGPKPTSLTHSAIIPADRHA